MTKEEVGSGSKLLHVSPWQTCNKRVQVLAMLSKHWATENKCSDTTDSETV